LLFGLRVKSKLVAAGFALDELRRWTASLEIKCILFWSVRNENLYLDFNIHLLANICDGSNSVARMVSR
jgi:hypothetical protein